MPVFSEDAGIERLDQIPLPEDFYGAVSTRVVQVNSDGASYVLNRAVVFNRVIARATLGGLGRALSWGIYQAPNGGDGIANLIATDFGVSFPTGNWVMTPDPPLPKVLNAGIFYLLYNQPTGELVATMRTYVGGTMDLTTVNVDSGTHPTVFTSTTITGDTGFPATMNPRTDLIASTLGLAMAIRFKKV